MSFAILLGGGIPERDGQTWRLTVPAEWMQGRTSFGGWASAMALTVAKEFGRDLPSIGGEPVDELPPLRSAMINFIGPVFGEIEASARVLRQGRNAIWIGVELSQDDGLVFTATFLFRRPMESRISVSNLPAPGNVVHPDTMAGLFIDLEKPAFIRAFEICPVSHEPHDGRPEEKWWVRFKRREGMDPEVELLLVGDLTPPGFIRMMNPMAPLSSMTWQVNFLGVPPENRDGWWLLRSESHHTQDGVNSQFMSVWDAAGVPVIASQQSTALFG